MAIKKDSLIDRVLGDSALYPQELRSWIQSIIPGDPLIKLEKYQVPAAEAINGVGTAGKSPFVGAWVNYGSSNQTAGYYKDPFGIIHVVGAVMSGVAGTTIFALPGGYVPAARETFTITTDTGIGRVDVDGSGNVIHVSGGTGFVSLAGITFRAL